MPKSELSELSDERLITQVAHGDDVALEGLYDRYSSAVMGLALRIVGNRNIAEDIVQETFWRIWHHAHGFSSEKGSFTNWMFTIAHRLCLDKLRRLKIRPEAVSSEAQLIHIERQPMPGDGVLETVRDELQRQEMLRALDNLPPEQLEVLRLVYFEGMTRREIASTMNLPLGTINTRARLAVEKLRLWLDAAESEK